MAVRRASGNRSLRLLFALAVVAAAAAPAAVVRADTGAAEGSQVARLLDRAAPEVREALSGEGGLAARGALAAIAARGAISIDQLESALGKPDFAPYARETLTALAKVDTVTGVPDTFGRLVSAGNEGALVGPPSRSRWPLPSAPTRSRESA